MKNTILFLIPLFLFLNISHSFAQKLDESYLPQIKGEIYPRNMIMQEDGKILLTGENLKFVDSIAVDRLIRLHPDSTLDTGFNPPKLQEGQTRIAATRNGKIIVFGGARSTFTCLNSNGSKNENFKLNIPDWSVLHVWGEDSTFLIHHFNVDGFFIERYNENGAKISSLDPVKFDDRVNQVLQLDNGQLVAGGYFTKVNGSDQRNLVLINPDGTIDKSLNPGTGFGSYSSNLKFNLHKGKILAIGHMSTYNEEKFPKGIVRINLDGSIDDEFVMGIISNSYTHPPFGVLADKNDNLYILGSVRENNDTYFNLQRFTSEGLIDYSFEKVTLNLTGYWNADLLENNSGDILIYGKFQTLEEIPKYNFVKYSNTKKQLEEFDLKLRGNGTIKEAIKLKNGKTCIMGDFTDVGKTPLINVAIINKDGSLDENFKPNYKFDTTAKDRLRNLTELDNGEILIGGELNKDEEGRVKLLLKIDSLGVVDTSFNVYSTNVSYYGIEDIAYLNSGKIIVVGRFNKINETDIAKVARLNLDGSIDESFNISETINSSNHWDITEVEIIQKNKILLAGIKNLSNSPAASLLMLFDSTGVLDSSFDELSNQNTRIKTLTKITEDKFIYGGYSGRASSYDTKTSLFQYDFNSNFNDSLSIKSSYKENNPNFNDILVLDSNNIIVGGIFDDINGFDNQGLAKVKTNGKIDRHFNFNVDGEIFSIVREDDDHILIFGNFEEVQGKVVHSGARIRLSNSLPKMSEDLELKAAEDSTLNFTAASLGIIDEDDPLEEVSVTFLPGENYTVEDNQVIPNENFSGELKIAIKVSDEKDTIDLIIPIEIIAQNDPPEIQEIVSELSIFETTSIAITKEDFIFSDPDNTLEEIDLILLEGENYQVVGDSVVVEEGFNGEITVRAQATDGESLGEVFEFTIEVQTITGLEDEILGKLIIYPNPAKSFIRITNQHNIQILGISLVDLSGKMYQIPFQKEADKWNLNVSHLKAGLYLVNIVLQNGIVGKKIQIQ